MKLKAKTVVDATEPLVLKISGWDVRNGRKKMPDRCAAAVAAARQCKGALSAHVHLSRAYIEYPDKIVRYLTPKALRTEIISFDRGHKFEAGEYDLLVPYAGVKLGSDKGADERKRKDPKRLKVKKRVRHVLSGVRVHAPMKSDWK